MKSKKVAILSLPCNPNYGFILQQWALYRIIERNGCSVVLLNRRWNRKKNNPINRLKTFVFLHFFCRPFYSFWKKMKRSPEIRSSLKLKQFVKSENLDSIVVGSDQIWRIEHTRGADLNYFCDFLEGEKIKRISYAPSFGQSEWKGSKEETSTVKRLLGLFDSLSVREMDGISLCKNYFDVDVRLVLDPTLLLSVDDYRKLIKSKKRNQKYIATYILDKSDEKDSFIKKIACQRPCVRLYERNRFFSSFISIEDWLTEIYYADYVIVDSFHGMVFSILFKKNFCVIANKRRGNSRFVSLLNELGLEDRLVYEMTEASVARVKKEIIYDDVDVRLDFLRKESENFLVNALNE